MFKGLLSKKGSELVAAPAPAAPAGTQELMAQLVGELLVNSGMERIAARVEEVGQEVREYNANIHALNLALGEFKKGSIDPIKAELEHLRYNLGSKVEGTVTMLEKMVATLDQQLSKFMDPNQKIERGLHAQVPHAELMTEKAIDAGAVLAGLEALHRRLDSLSNSQGASNIPRSAEVEKPDAAAG